MTLHFFLPQINQELIFPISLKPILLLSQLQKPFHPPSLPSRCTQTATSPPTQNESNAEDARRDVLVFPLLFIMRFPQGDSGCDGESQTKSGD